MVEKDVRDSFELVDDMWSFSIAFVVDLRQESRLRREQDMSSEGRSLEAIKGTYISGLTFRVNHA